MAEACIVMQQVQQVYGKKQVLSDINLTIEQGCIYGILGPSGCGKTTLVKAMAGILEPTAGSVQVLGEAMPNLAVMNRIGYMTQSDALYQNLSGVENLEFFGALYGLKKKDLQAAIVRALDLVKLTEAQHNLVSSYSGGMKRRLSLAAAILHQPRILILDEPTVGIDPVLRRQIWQALYDMVAHGTTVIVTTHVMDEADRCFQLMMMRDGMVLETGSPEAIKKKYGVGTIEEVFVMLGEVVQSS